MITYRESAALLLILFLSAPMQLVFAARDDGGKSSLINYNNGFDQWLPVSAANSLALSPTAAASKTFNCGGEGEKPCSARTTFFWDNGNLFCDRGLKGTGFKVLGDNVFFNPAVWSNLDRAALAALEELFAVDLPKLEEELNGLDETDFLTKRCLGVTVDGKCYTTPPAGPVPGVPGTVALLPDPNKPGWTVIEDLRDFINQANSRLTSAGLPLSIKSLIPRSQVSNSASASLTSPTSVCRVSAPLSTTSRTS